MSKYIGIIAFTFFFWNSTASAFVRCQDSFRSLNRLLTETEAYQRISLVENTLDQLVSQVNQKFGANSETNETLSTLLLKIAEQEAELEQITERFVLDELLNSKEFNRIDKDLAEIERSIQRVDKTLTEEPTRSKVQKKGPPEIKNIDGFDQVVPNKEYSIPSESESTFRVSFTDKALSDIMNKRLHPDYRKQFFKVLLKGIQPGTNESGIKIMKTHEGIFFAEIKLIGRLGDKRIFGLIQDNHISFRFLGTDSTSASDTNHKRIKSMKW